MQGEEEKTTREILFEVRRDVKWICLTLQEIKECQDDHENRLRGLESFRSEEIGNRARGTREPFGFLRGAGFIDSCNSEDLKDPKIVRLCAGIGAGAGGLVAMLMRLFG